jgi:hypothetical protein
MIRSSGVIGERSTFLPGRMAVISLFSPNDKALAIALLVPPFLFGLPFVGGSATAVIGFEKATDGRDVATISRIRKAIEGKGRGLSARGRLSAVGVRLLIARSCHLRRDLAAGLRFVREFNSVLAQNRSYRQAAEKHMRFH